MRVEELEVAIGLVEKALAILDSEGEYGSSAACSLSLGLDDMRARRQAARKLNEVGSPASIHGTARDSHASR
jgi:hypothetical protein